MAYQELTGIANPQSVIDAICSFAASNGWTVERNNLSGSNRTATIRIAGATDYIHIFNVDSSNIDMRISIGYNAANPPNTNPNVQEFDCRTNVLAGPYNRVYLMATGTEVNVVIELAEAGVYRHMAFGLLQKYGSYNGGTYADGSSRGTTSYRGDIAVNPQGNRGPFMSGSSFNPGAWPLPGALRADIVADSKTNYFNWFLGPFAVLSSTRGVAATGVLGSNIGIVNGSTSQDTGWLGTLVAGTDANSFSGRSILHPIRIFVARSGSPINLSAAGHIDNTRFCSIAKFDPGQELTIGTDVWKLFPVFRKSLTFSTAEDSADLGSYISAYAIRKTA